jgi:hypothetical protein
MLRHSYPSTHSLRLLVTGGLQVEDSAVVFDSLTLAALQVIKYLDQTNISTAYVSGLREDLSLTG